MTKKETAPEVTPVNNLLADKEQVPQILDEVEVKAFFDAHKAHRSTMVRVGDVVQVISKSAKSQYNSWLWNTLGERHNQAKRLHALEIKKHEDSVAVPVTGALRQSIKARGKAKQSDDAALQAAMMEAVLEELRSKGVDLSVLDA